MTTWLIRSSGDNNNGGTSSSVTIAGTAGVTNGTNTLTDATNPFTAAMVNQGINIIVAGSNNFRLITAFTNSGSITFSGATIATGTRSYRVGGSWRDFTNAVAAVPVAAGDSVYIGAGIYRQVVSPATSGAAGSFISYIGDVDGAKTSDAGQVVFTAFTTNDKSAPSGTLVTTTSQSYLSFSNITFIGGTGSIFTNIVGGHDYTFTDCVFNSLYYTGSATFNLSSPNAGAPLNAIFDRCVIVCSNSSAGISLTVTSTASGVADYDINVLFRNGLILCFGGNNCVSISGSGANTFRGGGVRVLSSTLAGYGCMVASGNNLSVKVPCEIHDSLVLSSGNAGVAAGATGQIIESNNVILGSTPRQQVAVGAGSSLTTAPMLELGQSMKWAGTTSSPRVMFSPDGPTSSLLGFNYGSGAASANTVDWQNRPRPSGGGSGAVAAASGAAVGFMEFHDYAGADGTVFQTGPSAAVLLGPGDQYLQIPVDGQTSASISVYVRFDGYASGALGGYPQVVLLANGELGIPSQTVTCSSVTGTWQQLSFNPIYPSVSGWVTLQVISRDINGTGTVHFDTIGVA